MAASRIPRAGSLEENWFSAIYIGTSQKIAVGAASVASSVFSAGVTVMRLYADADCYVTIGSVPVASATSMFLPAGILEYVGIDANDKIAVIQSGSSTGTLYLTEGRTT